MLITTNSPDIHKIECHFQEGHLDWNTLTDFGEIFWNMYKSEGQKYYTTTPTTKTSEVYQKFLWNDFFLPASYLVKCMWCYYGVQTLTATAQFPKNTQTLVTLTIRHTNELSLKGALRWNAQIYISRPVQWCIGKPMNFPLQKSHGHIVLSLLLIFQF